ncbi:hypothetical protein M431DRAFT_246340 [Trichoderma harzianum CBS 226.95]|uniref:Uncharacterized protein n=1 Tax=Trichoderma harzianum CBS 226.95 TaxID=983964 RepID=A0A2T4A184_TRIHA|nr:hypothetical protein M431DRAFT_246340 [Trichoderma harzianum CBS 226.95]PTB50832.1 hypothetical protein M431DRAFT_246340 [Trichoderma harzianum CBS 226.95]
MRRAPLVSTMLTFAMASVMSKRRLWWILILITKQQRASRALQTPPRISARESALHFLLTSLGGFYCFSFFSSFNSSNLVSLDPPYFFCFL